MTDFEHLIPTSSLKTTLLTEQSQGKRPVDGHFDYDPVADTFIMLFVSLDEDIIVHYVNENLGLLYRADDLEIVGLQVEAFERSFVPKHQNVQRAWRSQQEKTSYETLAELITIVQRLAKEKERRERALAEEIVKATEDVLGEPGREFAEILELA